MAESDVDKQAEDLLDAIALPKLASVAPHGRGKAKVPLTYTVVREVTEADLVALAQGLGVGTATPVTMTARHHRLAQLIADGSTQTAAAAIVGMTQQWVNRIANSAEFKEILLYYSSQKEARYLDVHSRLADLGATAGEILQNRMEESPEAFQNRELKEIMETAFDRSVAPAKGGPKAGQGAGAANVQVNVNFVQPPKIEGPKDEPLQVEAVEIKTIEGH